MPIIRYWSHSHGQRPYGSCLQAILYPSIFFKLSFCCKYNRTQIMWPMDNSHILLNSHNCYMVTLYVFSFTSSTCFVDNSHILHNSHKILGLFLFLYEISALPCKSSTANHCWCQHKDLKGVIKNKCHCLKLIRYIHIIGNASFNNFHLNYLHYFIKIAQ